MGMETKIPFLDLIGTHLELEEELVRIFRATLRTAGFVGGPVVETFERNFAQFCETKYCVGVSNGTDAVRFALVAAGVQPGDAVVTVPNTFIATTEAISQAGALPEFVDVDERTYNIDPAKLDDYLTNQCARDRAGRLISQRSGRPVTTILPVHLYGQMADMDPILEIAERFGLIVIEDACQAHGAMYFSKKANRWMMAGSIGRAAAFSFYPGKNLGACGEAGAVITNVEGLAEKVKMLRDHGQSKKYYHDMEGYNGRLDALQAGLLHAKLPHLAQWNNARREHAAEYNRLLEAADCGVSAPFEPSWSKAVYHLYVIRSRHREGLMKYLADAGIGTGIHYPVPLHVQKAYAALQYKIGDFPVAEKLSPEIVSLPMFPQMTREQQANVIEEISNFAARQNPARAEAQTDSLEAAGRQSPTLHSYRPGEHRPVTMG